MSDCSLGAQAPALAHDHADFTYPLPAAADDAHADAWKRWADDFSRDLRTSMGMAFSHRPGLQKVVKGAPFSAEVVTETKQTLADGNVIARKTTGAVYRDGEGRMRQESGGDGKEPSVFILDPVAGKHYVIAPGAKAHAMSMPMSGAHDGKRERQAIRVNGTEIRVDNGKVTIDGKEVTAPPTQPVPGAAPVPPVPPLPSMPGVQTLRFESTAKLGKGVTTSLGSKEFDGVKAEGKSTAWTIPAGEIGNKNPIQVTVYSRYNDPRTGETVYRLANVKRGEPSAELFKVPEEALAKPKAKGKG